MNESFIEKNNAEINVDELLSMVGKEVPHQQSVSFNTQMDFSGGDKLVDIPALNSSISSAAAETEVGTQMTPMNHFRWALVRGTARGVGRVILYLSQVITAQQRRFNNFVVNTLTVITSNLEKLDTGFSAWKHHENLLLDEIKKEFNTSFKDINNQVSRFNDELSHHDMTISELRKVIAHLKTTLALQECRLTMLLEEARKRLPEPFDEEHLKRFSDEKERMMDALYVSTASLAMNDKGNERLKHYLSLIRSASGYDRALPVVVLGCGEGQWLEFLKKEGIIWRGAEVNSVLARRCKDRGFDVTRSDILSFLRALPDESTAAVTAFHIIEYLSYEQLIRVLDEIIRILAPGGVVILEALNPHNLKVSTFHFYADPRHRTLIPDCTLKLTAEARGFVRVKSIELSPSSIKDNDSESARQFNEYFSPAWYYAVIGYKT
jgi:SAM-dependent methyltransferase